MLMDRDPPLKFEAGRGSPGQAYHHQMQALLSLVGGLAQTDPATFRPLPLPPSPPKPRHPGGGSLVLRTFLF
jgi:hypothetical protein